MNDPEQEGKTIEESMRVNWKSILILPSFSLSLGFTIPLPAPIGFPIPFPSPSFTVRKAHSCLRTELRNP